MRHLRTLQLIEAVARTGSIRKAAEDTNITASALNRRINAFEEEFGSPIFERLPRGMRLNPAGELVLGYYRKQKSELQRLHSQVADLSGRRRGHVTIACSQALLPFFLPEEVSRYRGEHPGVTFSINVRDREKAEADLQAFRSDLALVFEPLQMADFKCIFELPQTINVVMSAQHPLAEQQTLRLRHCLAHVHIAPSPGLGVRDLLDVSARRLGLDLQPVVETESFELMRHYVLHEQVLGFQIPIGMRECAQAGVAGMVMRPLDVADVPPGHLLLGYLRGRTLPVAAARFAQQLSNRLEAEAHRQVP